MLTSATENPATQSRHNDELDSDNEEESGDDNNEADEIDLEAPKKKKAKTG